MQFLKKLHPGIRDGRITATVRIWARLQVKVGGRYQVAGGAVEVDSIEEISVDAVTDELARACGFHGAIDMLGVAQHGRGKNVYLIRFHYVPSSDAR